MKKDNKVNPADIVKGFSAALTTAGYVHKKKNLLDMKRKEGDATCDSTKKSETQTQTSTGVAGSVAPKGSTPAAATTVTKEEK